MEFRVKLDWRAVVKFLTKEGSTPTEIHQWLVHVYGTDTPHYSAVAKWSSNFARGRHSLEDDPRSRKPSDATMRETIRNVGPIIIPMHPFRI